MKTIAFVFRYFILHSALKIVQNQDIYIYIYQIVLARHVLVQVRCPSIGKMPIIEICVDFKVV